MEEDKLTFEKLATDINARLEAIGQAVAPETIEGMVRTYFDKLMADKAFVRKMRFATPDAPLVGSKFARWGYTPADVEFLYDVLNSAQRIGRSRGPSNELRQAFKDVSEATYGVADDSFDTRAMDTAESGYGSQLIGAQYVGELWEAARRESRVFALLDTFEMEHPTAYIPVEVDVPELYYVSENTANNSSNYTTVKTGSNRVTVSAIKFVIHQMWSGEMEEDSIIPFIPFLRRQAQLSLAHYSDSIVLNGDTTNTATGNINLDDADPTDTKHYLAMDGIRHACIVDNTNNASSASGNAVTWDDCIGLRKLMVDRTYLHDWGHPVNPQDLVYVVDPETADEIAKFDELVTVDKYGPQATVLAGEVGRIGRHPLIDSIALSLTEADGKVSTTSANNVYGQVLAFNRRGLKVGWRRRVKLETERLPATDQTRLVYSLRMGLGRFTPSGAASGIEWAALKYYIAV